MPIQGSLYNALVAATVSLATGTALGATKLDEKVQERFDIQHCSWIGGSIGFTRGLFTGDPAWNSIAGVFTGNQAWMLLPVGYKIGRALTAQQ